MGVEAVPSPYLPVVCTLPHPVYAARQSWTRSPGSWLRSRKQDRRPHVCGVVPRLVSDRESFGIGRSTQRGSARGGAWSRVCAKGAVGTCCLYRPNTPGAHSDATRLDAEIWLIRRRRRRLPLCQKPEFSFC